MENIVVIGAGQIGRAIAKLLTDTGEYAVTIADRAETQLKTVGPETAAQTAVVDVKAADSMHALLAGKFAVISAAPYDLTEDIAAAALRAGTHYIDLTEDVASTEKVKALATSASTAFVPQCGLAPGFISILANDLCAEFDTIDEVKLRVGALPQFPDNSLRYNFTWSPEGVVNEYIEPCDAIVNGQRVKVPALDGLETMVLDGTDFEAFNTSGGLGSLTDVLGGKARNVTYKTIRFPGHNRLMRLLLQELGMAETPEACLSLLKRNIPTTRQDMIVIYADVTGTIEGQYCRRSFQNKVLPDAVRGLTAIQLTTASSACAILDLLKTGEIGTRGYIMQETIPLKAFFANRFGKVFAPAALAAAAA